jgi:hypothetical protein
LRARTVLVKDKNKQAAALVVYTPRGSILIEPCKGWLGTIQVTVDLIEPEDAAS